jgi:protease-4
VDGIDTIAQGRVWAGSEAINLKLVDEIGGLDQAIVWAADKAKLGKGMGDYRVKEYPEKPTFAETLAALLSNEQEPVTRAKADPLTQEYLQVKSEIKTLREFNDPLGAYARMPLGWEIK